MTSMDLPATSSHRGGQRKPIAPVPLRRRGTGAFDLSRRSKTQAERDSPIHSLLEFVELLGAGEPGQRDGLELVELFLAGEPGQHGGLVHGVEESGQTEPIAR
jgi:hypothetical protein